MTVKILLVEDEASLRELYAAVLTDEGYDVSSAQDGESALRLLNTQVWDLIFLDIMLPRLDGVDVLRRVRNNVNTKDTPVAIISNLDDYQIVKDCEELGITDYLVKADVTPDALINVVQKVVSAKSND